MEPGLKIEKKLRFANWTLAVRSAIISSSCSTGYAACIHGERLQKRRKK
jgi:hypothetical protein